MQAGPPGPRSPVVRAQGPKAGSPRAPAGFWVVVRKGHRGGRGDAQCRLALQTKSVRRPPSGACAVVVSPFGGGGARPEPSAHASACNATRGIA
jgi:hypothetical protein